MYTYHIKMIILARSVRLLIKKFDESLNDK